ncbi:hypothetical protein [Butyrivibrio hungatei]|uniref:Uncharacterized protein n=1 Tax=Butyrivibrio hungatei TaxID=185008 RepID=A0A1D9P5I6_9FIRM|nr:hypothetical protein [Butyrivibrio hungatei]AOZ97830.1 hypothetical protein bhn_II031 [Butyrivibrio hungatei]
MPQFFRGKFHGWLAESPANDGVAFHQLYNGTVMFGQVLTVFVILIAIFAGLIYMQIHFGSLFLNKDNRERNESKRKLATHVILFVLVMATTFIVSQWIKAFSW